MRARKFLSIFATLFVVLLPVVGFWQRQAIFDWVRLRGYMPSEQVASLATNTTMSNSMRRLFYVYHPGIEDKTTFNKSCRDNEQTIVLGCYVDRIGIHLLDVTDSRLAGIEEVTAAHEVLHAAYARLGTLERKEVDLMTSMAFSALTDQRIKDTIELYRKQDPSIVPNELHSILGTEMRNLPADLEDYYKQYFTDRSKIVSYSEQYEKAFTERKNQIVAYDAQLESLKTQIDSLQSKLEKSAASLSAQRAQLDAERAAGNIAAYNAGVSGYNKSVAAYNQQIDQLTALVAQFNDIVPRRNAIASEESDLVKAIDSRETVPGKQ